MAKSSSVLLLPHYRDNNSFSLHIRSKFTVTCCDLTLAAVNYLQRKSCIMKRDEVLLAFSLLLGLKRSRKGKKPYFLSCCSLLIHLFNKAIVANRKHGSHVCFLQKGSGSNDFPRELHLTKLNVL